VVNDNIAIREDGAEAYWVQRDSRCRNITHISAPAFLFSDGIRRDGN
jgi:hypothetical protein